MKVCSIADCDRPVRVRGWCNKHYLRWSRYGDPLVNHQNDRQVRKLSLSEIQRQTGATYRQLDHWSRRGYLPFGEPGSGNDRLWSEADLDSIRYLVQASRLSLPQVAALIRDSEQEAKREEVA